LSHYNPQIVLGQHGYLQTCIGGGLQWAFALLTDTLFHRQVDVRQCFTVEVQYTVCTTKSAIWPTDIHLESLDHRGFSSFMGRLREQIAEAVLISGDSAQAPSACGILIRFRHHPQWPY